MAVVNLSPIFNGWQAFTAAGLPLSGGLLNTYIAGTSTPAATYTTNAGTITNSNPIVLDAAGRLPAEVWLVAGTAYKFVLTDSLGTNPLTYDNIAGIGDVINLTVAGNSVLGTTGSTLNVSNGAITVASGNTAIGGDLTVAGNTTLGNNAVDVLTIYPSAIAWQNNPTHAGNHTFAGSIALNGTLTGATDITSTGNTTLGNALGDTLTVAGGALKVFSDGRMSGNKLHNIGAVTGTTDQFLASGTYTPSTTLILNASAANAVFGPFQWIRLGNVVTCSGVLQVDPTAGAAATTVDISLPIATASTLVGNLAGTGVSNLVTPANVFWNTGGVARMTFTSASTAHHNFSLTFTYVVA